MKGRRTRTKRSRSGSPGLPPTPQAGILAVGTGAHVYLEVDRTAGARALDLVHAVAGLREARTTTAGVNLVVGFRPGMWRRLLPGGIPREVVGFDRALRGPDGYTMPATQHDAVLWLSGMSQDVVFDEARAALRALGSVASVSTETVGWTYRRDRDLTGFVDGTENPTLVEAPAVALVPARQAGAGGSVLLLQKWRHLAARWESLSVAAQERVIGRTKADSVELEPKPSDSHAGRTDQDVFGKIFRRNVAYGTVTDHGTIFVGFCASQRPLREMLESMLGLRGGPRDALTRFARPLTGAFYFVPSLDALQRFAPQSEGAEGGSG